MISKKTAKIIHMFPKPLLKKVVKFILDGYIKKYADITVINKELLGSIKRPVIFISNHLSNSDGLILNKILGDGSVWYLAGVKLSHNEITKLGLDIVKTVPINPNSPDISAISKAVELLKSGQSVCIFPEGTRSRSASLIKGKRGIILIAKLCRLPIVPIGIEGTERLMPINDEDMGKERFFHADVRVTIGESFYIPERSDNENRRKYEEKTIVIVMKKIASLLSPEYRGIYGE
ncbi:MAG: lysophospholipid acyltransferase family protein [Clostridiales bacterium]|nr:lysophospholipid acyltransferase family protein [Clostridiales bacterium]